MYLSRNDITRIAGKVIRRYNIFAPPEYSSARRIDPVQIATDLLHLSVEHVKLSSDGSILGVTSYGKAGAYILDEENSQSIYSLDGNTILIEKSLYTDRYKGRYNFTVAHELGHQILQRMYPNDYGVKNRSSKTVYYRDKNVQKSRIDWEEWQADTLAAEMLMPSDLVKDLLRRYGLKRKNLMLNPIFNSLEYQRFGRMANFLGVSKETLSIRLKHMGVLTESYMKEPQAIMDIFKD